MGRMILMMVVLSGLVVSVGSRGVLGNIRGPLNSFSYSGTGLHSPRDSSSRRDSSVWLLSEKLSVDFPQIDTNESRAGNWRARVRARYVVESRNPTKARYSLRFLAYGVKEHQVTVGGQTVAVRLTHANPEDWAAAESARLRGGCEAEAQSLYRKDVKGDIERLLATQRSKMGNVNPPGGIDRCEEAVLHPELFGTYGELLAKEVSSEPEWWGSPHALDFEALLNPDRTTIEVAYEQSLGIKEGSYSYFSGFGYPGAEFAFDYLLYPAKEWNRAPDFMLTTEVNLPIPKNSGWFWDSEAKHETQIQPPMQCEEVSTWMVSCLRSDQGLPSDILHVGVKLLR